MSWLMCQTNLQEREASSSMKYSAAVVATASLQLLYDESIYIHCGQVVRPMRHQCYQVQYGLSTFLAMPDFQVFLSIFRSCGIQLVVCLVKVKHIMR
jgi:hypothetical protein